MKIIAFLFILTWVSPVFAQDTIQRISTELIHCKVVEVGPDSISYEIIESGSNLMKRMANSEITSIHLSNGTTIVLARNDYQMPETTLPDATEPGIGPMIQPETEGNFEQGQLDAIRYYKNYSVAGTATAAFTVLNPLAGLVVATATSSSKPSLRNLGIPKEEFKNQPTYVNGYLSEASRIKSNKVWKNFGIVIGVQVALVSLFILSYAAN